MTRSRHTGTSWSGLGHRLSAWGRRLGARFGAWVTDSIGPGDSRGWYQ